MVNNTRGKQKTTAVIGREVHNVNHMEILRRKSAMLALQSIVQAKLIALSSYRLQLFSHDGTPSVEYGFGKKP